MRCGNAFAVSVPRHIGFDRVLPPANCGIVRVPYTEYKERGPNMALTERERQILSWIEQNPMISQNDLAELCGITRSGVAAHISNLMRKGYIQGKGYVLTPARYVAVIGAINMDVYGFADNDVVGSLLSAASRGTSHIISVALVCAII